MQERVHCYKCFVSTHEHDYTQYFYNVMAKGIGDQEARLPGQPLGHTLRELESHSLKSCDDEKGMVTFSHVHCLLLLYNFCVEVLYVCYISSLTQGASPHVGVSRHVVDSRSKQSCQW